MKPDLENPAHRTDFTKSMTLRASRMAFPTSSDGQFGMQRCNRWRGSAPDPCQRLRRTGVPAVRISIHLCVNVRTA